MAQERVTTNEDIKRTLIDSHAKEFQTGITYDQVESFIQSLGMEVKPYVIVSEEDLGKYREVVDDKLGTQYQGWYNPTLDLALVLRDKRDKKLGSSLVTEGVLVHELVHANIFFRHRIPDYFAKKKSEQNYVWKMEDVYPWGIFLEEGWADMHRALYIKQYADDVFMEQLICAYRADEAVFNAMSGEDTILIPAIPWYYYDPTSEGLGIHKWAYAGYAMELLCQHYPRFYAAFSHARRLYGGLDQLKLFMESIQPGLYERLQQTGRDKGNFIEQLSWVQGVVGKDQTYFPPWIE